MNAKKYDIRGIQRPAKENNAIKTAPGGPPKEKTIMVKKEVGRPKKNKEEKLTEKITICLTKKEMAKIKKLSEDHFDVAIGVLVRKALQDGLKLL